MGKSLVIVESPAKAKTINRYLGKDFIVKSSIGHIRDLPTGSTKKTVDAKARAQAAAKLRQLSPAARARQQQQKAKAQLIDKMGIDPDNGWQAHYAILPGKEKVVDELRRLAATAEAVYLATDRDREGEAIAWHLKESIGAHAAKFRRVVFNEITRQAIRTAFADPGYLNQDHIDAQQARRFLDRVVGYMVSPLLWAKIARGLSAGRVQSVAVRLIVERERAIRRFVPEEYWEVYADLLTAAGEAIRFQVVKAADAAFRPIHKAVVDNALAALRAGHYVLADREDKPTRSKPSAPYITSTLQQAASTRLGFGVKKTMILAQRLYEAGHITYMRTDSTNLSSEAVDRARDFINERYGSPYLPNKPVFYANKAGAQAAHEAIRPADVLAQPGQVAGLERDAERLYTLIWRQFVACQMTPAQYLSTTLTTEAAGFELKAKGRLLQFDGYTKVQPPIARAGDDIVLPAVSPGDTLTLQALDPRQLFTQPPARFSEAALVKELEKRGIGRPSTYATIISTIQDRGYVSIKQRRFYAEKMGDIVTDRLVESFSDLMDYSFTARMEENLDAIAEGKQDWQQVLNAFYADFNRQLEQAAATESGMRLNAPSPTAIPCPTCNRPMLIRTGSTGVFLGCSGYALPPKERCKTTVNLVPGVEVERGDEAHAEVNALRAMHRCPQCATAMESYLIDATRKLHVCGNNPDCPGYEVEQGHFKLKGYDGPTLTCDKCGTDMQLKTGRFGKYFGCTNTACNNTRKLLKNGEPAPPKMEPVPIPELQCRKVDDHYVLRDGAAGLFLAASQFPKNRETRAPLVAELVRYQRLIPSKYHYLLNAPPTDPDGHPSIIRYSRKTKQQYVMSEVEGRATGWRAIYQDGQWCEQNSRAKPRKS